MILDPSRNHFVLVPAPTDAEGNIIAAEPDAVRIDCAWPRPLPHGLEDFVVNPEHRLHGWGDTPGTPLMFPDLTWARAVIPGEYWAEG